MYVCLPDMHTYTQLWLEGLCWVSVKAPWWLHKEQSSPTYSKLNHRYVCMYLCEERSDGTIYIYVCSSFLLFSHPTNAIQITFAVGVSVAMACVAKTLSRATVVPASNLLGGYIGGLWYTVVMCLFSTLAGKHTHTGVI